MIRVFISFLIWFFVQLPLVIIGVFIIPIMLMLGWAGYSSLWGNLQWGAGATNPSYMKTGFWAAYNWLALRNPTSNLGSRYLSVIKQASMLTGNANIGDKKASGSYWIKMGLAWEYYYIKPWLWNKVCIRFRAGWKLADAALGDKCSFVFSYNPIKPYSGI